MKTNLFAIFKIEFLVEYDSAAVTTDQAFCCGRRSINAGNTPHQIHWHTVGRWTSLCE